jgi:hypothetical protein
MVELSGVPGTHPYLITLYVNGNPSAVAVTIAADGTTGVDTDSVDVSAGDYVYLKCTRPDGDPANTPSARWSILWTGDTANESIIMGGAQGVVDATAYAPISNGAYYSNATEALTCQCIPTGGTLKSLYVRLATDPGAAPDAYTFTLRKAGDTTLTCTITADNTTGNDTAHTVAVVAGDLVDMAIVPVETPATASYVAWGMVFAATTDGESLILGGNTDSPSNSATQYANLQTGIIGAGWQNTEAQQGGQAHASNAILRNFYVALQNAPDVGNTFTFTVRKTGPASTDLVIAITGAATTGSDTAHTYTMADYDDMAIMSVPDSTPTTGCVYWGLVCYIAESEAYTYSATVKIASTLTTARLLTLGRSVSSALGAKAASSKGMGKSSAISLGIVATGTRTLGLVRSAAVKLGTKATAARALALSRSKSVSVGAKVAGSRLIGVTRTAAVSSGIVAVGAYLNMIVKAATVAIGAVVTASRALGLTRAASLAIGAKAAQHYASTRYEYLNTGDTGASSLYTTNWRGQTFTPSAGHTVTSVKLLIYRTGNPGTFTVSIRGTAAGVPSGADLCSGTTDGDALSLDGAGEWKEITFGSGTPLTAGTMYAIVARSAGADSSNSVCWRLDSTSPTYDGTVVTSSNSGSSWSIASGSDYMFEEWAQYLTFGPKLALLRSGSVASGIVGAGNRVASAIRSASVSVGSSVTASRAFAGLRSASLSVGASVTSTAVKALTRTAAISSGIVATASKGIGKTASIALGIVAVGSKATGTFSVAYQAIAVKLNVHAISSALNARAATIKQNVKAIGIKLRTRV